MTSSRRLGRRAQRGGDEAVRSDGNEENLHVVLPAREGPAPDLLDYTEGSTLHEGTNRPPAHWPIELPFPRQLTRMEVRTSCPVLAERRVPYCRVDPWRLVFAGDEPVTNERKTRMNDIKTAEEGMINDSPTTASDEFLDDIVGGD